ADAEPLPPPTFLRRARFVKCGLAECATFDWRVRVTGLRTRLAEIAPNCRLAVTAYADWRRAGSIEPWEVGAFAVEHGLGGLLLDTWRKDGRALLDWLSAEVLEELCRHCRQGSVEI